MPDRRQFLAGVIAAGLGVHGTPIAQNVCVVLPHRVAVQRGDYQREESQAGVTIEASQDGGNTWRRCHA